MKQTLPRLLTKVPTPVRWTLLLVLIAAFVAGIVVWNERQVRRDREKTDANWSLIARPISAEDHVVGNVDAPVELIVYGDLSCKYCKGFYTGTMPSLQQKYGDSVVFAYRHLPLAIHPAAHAEAVASECVYSQKGDGAFWKFVQAVYRDPGYESGLSNPKLREIALSLDATGRVYDQCINSKEVSARIEKDTLEAAVAGLGITPSIILKSPHRALTITGNYPDQISSAVSYLLDVEKQLSAN